MCAKRDHPPSESDYFSTLIQTYLMEGKKDKGTRLFSVLFSERTRVNMYRLKSMTLHLYQRGKKKKLLWG